MIKQPLDEYSFQWQKGEDDTPRSKAGRFAFQDMLKHRSPKARTYLPWYSSKAWQSIRSHQLAIHPLCAMCEAAGQVTVATVCDHIIPHKGDWHRFINGPFQSLCKPCHDRHKQSAERTGKLKPVIGPDGWPIG